MNGKKAKAARRAAAEAEPPERKRTWLKPVLGLAAVALVAASFVTPKLFQSEEAAPAHSPTHELGVGLAAGAAVPQFKERDLISGKTISSASLKNKKTLLFFSEGVMCQACFEQIKGLEQMQAELDKRGIELVSITPDTPENLEQAIAQFAIESPMIADDDRDMSAAFNTLGKGMHPDTPGHAFALIERGKVLWYRDYWLPPDRTMYVEPAKVLADLEA